MNTIIEIAKKIKSNGGKLYLVGGAVRDEILNIENHDRDYVVVGIDKLVFESIFPEAIKRGKDFEVYDMYGSEFAMARIERKVAART